MRFMRRFRAAITVGLLWAAAWALSGVLFATWRVFLGHPRLVSPALLWPRFALMAATILGAAGLTAGLVFAAGLRRRTAAQSVDALPTGRSVRWGAVAGAVATLVLPVVGITAPVPLLVAGVTMAAVGATSALTTVKVARRATTLNEAPPVDSLHA